MLTDAAVKARPPALSAALPLCGVLRELPLQRTAMQAEQPGGFRHIAAAFQEHAVDVFPLESIERHRLEAGCRFGLAPLPRERRQNLVGIRWLRQVLSRTALHSFHGRRNAAVPSQD